jgi:hypothetical protein
MVKASQPVRRASIVPAALMCLCILYLSVLFPSSGLGLDLGFPGLTDAFSPLVFPPTIHAEARVTPIWVSIVSGKVSVAPEGTWDLREQFALNSGKVFLDSMGRLQIGSFSVRLHYEPRFFAGKIRLPTNPGVTAESNFDFSGVRLGGDWDLFQRNLSRIGLDVDYYIYLPAFTQAIQSQIASEIIGQNAVTLGAHVIYNPINNFYGMSGICEARARWSVGGTSVRDLELAAGIKAPATVMGNVALRGGYRRTMLEYIDSRYTLDAIIAGWFGEIAYYY